MKRKWSARKKAFTAAVCLVLAAAIGLGAWFGVRGGGEPVSVYPFLDLGMTEYWGDSQESYGPVSTDKIQTVYLTDTQTVTEVLVSDGDQVKEGDVLMTFDTTLTELELERKRLAVEKQKLDLQDAENQLYRIRTMKPMDPNAWDVVLPELEENLGEELLGQYAISENREYDGSDVSKPLILWLRDGGSVTDPVLRAVYEAARAYRYENQTQTPTQPNSSASDVSEESKDVEVHAGSTQDPSEPSGTTENGGQTEGGQPNNNATTTVSESTTESDDPVTIEDNPGSSDTPPAVPEPQSGTVTIHYVCNSQTVQTQDVTVGQQSVTISDAYSYNNATYWFDSATGADGAALRTLTIPAYPQNDADAQKEWRELWSSVTVEYIRDVTLTSNKAVENEILTLEQGKETAIVFTANMDGAPKGGSWTWKVEASSGEDALSQQAFGNVLILSGEPEKAGKLVSYSVTATYNFQDNKGQNWAVQKTFLFATQVAQESMGEPIDDYYMVLKITEENMSRGERLIWQGIHVLRYDDGSFGFALFDASALEDHSLEPLEEEELELPDIDIGSGYTAAEIAKMRSEQEKVVKELDLALRMAQAEYAIMEAEVNDGAIRAQFDGQVVGLLTEEEARQEKRPMLKVSAGGGFYVECSVSELEMDNLRIGMEVTINDWNTGMTYTGTVESKGDFPVSPNGWSSSNNLNTSYYPFSVFIGSEADLQAGTYVSVTYSTATSENGIYLQKPFLREEGGRSYVYVRGEDGRLEQRFVSVGKSLWGSYTEVTSGLTEEDYIAFPYGKTVKAGAPTVEGSLADLYSY